MNAQKSPTAWVVGLAFFSMFFGSGNLIFPLMLGARYGGDFLPGILGFIITAVFLPMLGVLAMIPAQGSYEKVLEGPYPKSWIKVLAFIILVFWIPLGSGPRCVILAHSSLQTYLPFIVPQWLFSFGFLALCFVSISNPSRMINFLGKVLTPLLLLSIGLIVGQAFLNPHYQKMTPSSQKFFEVFSESLVEGYYTQDLIASIFFSSSLVTLLQTSTKNLSHALKLTWQGGILASVILTLIYGALMFASSVYQTELLALSGDQLVSHLAKTALGEAFGSISCAAVSLACLTTEIALIVVFSDFLHRYVLPNYSRYFSIGWTMAIIWFLALFPFQQIMGIIDPAMKVIYPLLVLFCFKAILKI